MGDPKIGEQQKDTFFGSKIGVQVNALAEQMSHEKDPMAGLMLKDIIEMAVGEPELDREAVEQRIFSTFNFDDMTGERLDDEAKKAALARVMEHFDDLQEIRDAVIARKLQE